MATVLVVDDSNDDLMLVRRAIRKLSFQIDLRTLDCGEQALWYVRGGGPYGDRRFYPMPGLMILDLKMPRLSGFDVLAELQTTNTEQRPPVVVMSSSCLAQDVERAYALGASAFYAKPADFTQLCGILNHVITFFCTESSGSQQAYAPLTQDRSQCSIGSGLGSRISLASRSR